MNIGVYVPFELSAIVAGAAYAVIATTWHGRTIGKSLCGLRVGTKSGVPLGLVRTLVRETVGKFVSFVLLFGGFLWGVWGHKEYWDVIETVWKINRQRSPGKPPLRRVGLGIPIDLPTFTLLGFE